jgi:acyl-CoA synthetase (AMP-forming)/AMP-acid ligase II/thioesterase domain-containing protein
VLPSGPEAVVANIAVACHAATVPLDPLSTSAELEERFTALRLGAVVVSDGTRAAAEAVAERQGMTVFTATGRGRPTGFLALVARSIGRAIEDVESRSDDVALILNTSGTTARPKLVPVTHGNLAAMAAKMQRWFGLSCNDRSLCVMPLHYAQGLKQSVFAAILSGGSIGCSNGPPSLGDFLERLSDLAPTWYSAGPTHHGWVLELARSRPGARHSLRFIQSAAAHLPEPVRCGLEDALGVPILEGYGLSEAGLMAANPTPPALRKPGTAGLAWPGEVVVVGDGGQRLQRGGAGEILVRGPSVMPGYLDNPQLNREAFLEDGWFRTGDLGTIDDEGFLTVLGRVQELINRGGEKISPGEIDQALLRNPAIAEAAAFGVPHQRLGEDVGAAVVMRAGYRASPADIRQFLRGKLTPSKVPRRVFIVDELPKGGTGKLQRARLRELLQADSDARHSARKQIAIPSLLEFELAELWRRLLHCDAVALDADFFEQGGDSLLATEMLLEVERLTGRTLPSDILFDAPTVSQLAWSIAGPTSAEPKSLIPLQTTGSAPPFFFFHGDYSSGGYYARRLARLLGPEQPFVAVAPNKFREAFRLPPIEEMAAERVALLLDAWPHGPFRLGGYCSGALVAYETARLLIEARRQVELVAMIDPPTFNAHPVVRRLDRVLSNTSLRFTNDPAIWQERFGSAMTMFWLCMTARERLSRMPRAERRAWIRDKLKERVFGWRYASNRDEIRRPGSAHRPSIVDIAMPRHGVIAEVAEYNLQTIASLMRVLKAYVPKPAPLPVIYFAAAHDGTRWRGLTRDFDVVPIACDHVQCVTTHLDVIAKTLRARMGDHKRS